VLGGQTPKSLLYTLRYLLTLHFDLRSEEEMRNSGPFYLTIIENPKSKVWYKKQRMGVNKIDSFMKNMALEVELDVLGEAYRPVPYLNLWFRFTAEVTAKTVISKLLSLNYFMLFALNGLNWFHKKTANQFYFHLHKKIVLNADPCVFSTVTR